ncbi:hypothetical protein FYJ85_11200 [Victivallaceae bacterium BBE-744-WT-12]|uniref:Uncharacterized protein n=1 Tax=Victivallis lenta TaxID=2606640 RepID=A0A844G3Q9_9BACT|nr:hypothetical protein [Victivallis lenta]MST97604.1 hypothetical protein [Victivallis lenta]
MALTRVKRSGEPRRKASLPPPVKASVKAMTKKEFADWTGKSLPAVRKLCDKGRFFLDGFGEFEAVKTGTSKTAPLEIRPVEAAPVEQHTRRGTENLSFAELKARKLEAEIRHLEQRTLDRQETIERNFEAEIIEKLIDALQPLKDAFVKCKLTPEQTSLITGALNESLQQLERSLIQ